MGFTASSYISHDAYPNYYLGNSDKALTCLEMFSRQIENLIEGVVGNFFEKNMKDA